MTPVEKLISYFESGAFPNSTQFKELIQSLWHKSERIPLEQIETLVDNLSSKFEKGTYQGDAQSLYNELKKAINEKVFNGTNTYPTLAAANAINPFPVSGTPMKIAKDGANNGRYFSNGVAWEFYDNDLDTVLKGWIPSLQYSNETFNSDELIISADIKWSDDDIGTLSNVTTNDIGYTSLRYNRSNGDYVTATITYDSNDFPKQILTLTKA